MEKNMKKIVLSFAFFALPSVGFAHGNIFSTTTDSVSAAIVKFQTEDRSIVDAYKGLRAWHSGAVVKVRFYYGDDNASLLYQCEMKHYENGEEEIICSEQ